MAFAAPLIGLASAGLGLYQSVKGMKDARRQQAPAVQQSPVAPKAEDASKSAAMEVRRRRRISMLSGGQTNKTQGMAQLGAGSVAQKTLLGA
jgi:ABC-type Mn2+/Zn2+ transport system ATPase subunit